MKIAWRILLAIGTSLPLHAHAGAYKCQQPNGSVAYQDHPCPKGAAGSAIKLAPVQGYSDGGPHQTPESSSSPTATARSAAKDPRYPYAQPGDVEELKARNAELQATNARMKAENPDWQHSQTLSRQNDKAEALNKQIEGK